MIGFFRDMPTVAMSDHVDKGKRSEIMRAVRSKGSGPELLVRSAAHRLGLRFRLHRKDLPGRPDLTLPKWRTVVFVNGCFWHRHAGCKKATTPKSNTEFWQSKFNRNVERDQANYSKLRDMGWRVVVVWQCEARNLADVQRLLKERVVSHGRKPEGR